MSRSNLKNKAYLMPIILISSLTLGGISGCFLGEKTDYLKPFGEIFINLIFTAIVPLIFFSISSAIARAGSSKSLGKIMSSMSLVFIFTGLVAALYALAVVLLFPPAEGVTLSLTLEQSSSVVSLSQQLVGMFTVSDFSKLLSHEHMLALIVFSIVVGLAVAQTKEQGALFLSFLSAGEAIFMRVFHLIMYYAPIGFFAYFAVLVHELGPQLMGSYARIAVLYYLAAVLYFLIFYTVYAYLAGQSKGVRLFWTNILLPMMTSLATCSSAASIPANLSASKNMHISPTLCDTSIPLGSLIHKDGSVIGGMFKIAFLFGLFHLPFSGAPILCAAIGISLLVGTVMGAIPSGGMLGELLILSVYGFPPSALITIAAISIIIDPLATMLNVTGNSVSTMMIARLVDGKNWCLKKD